VAAKTLQIEHLLTRRPSQLSGGQRQRVAMGRALVRKPRVFLFDEPLSNLDAKLRVEVRAEIKSLHQNTHATIVYVTHDQIEAMTLATKIVVLKEGAVQQVGTPAEIYNLPANVFVADFMGSPAMNMLQGKVRGDGADQKIALFDAAELLVPIPATVAPGALKDGQSVIVGLRPETITDQSLSDPQARQITTIEAHVTMVEPTGSDTFVTAQVNGKTFTARTRADVSLSVGQPFQFVMNLDKAVVFDPQTTVRL
jgi:multiple sugar transport system ATP-binding protein